MTARKLAHVGTLIAAKLRHGFLSTRLPSAVVSGWVLIVGYLASVAALPHVLLAKKRPVATLAWVWFILLVPFFGIAAYFAFGADRMKRRRLRRAARTNFPAHGESDEAKALLAEQREPVRHLLRSLAVINQVPPATARSVRLLVDAAQFYPALEQAIRAARHHVHIEFFIWRDDEVGRRFLDLLCEAVQRGVEVRLLCDQMGGSATPRAFFDPLVAAGGQFAWFYSQPYLRHLRFVNLRNHRKLQIIDGTLAFVGGMNMGEEYAGKGSDDTRWRDAQLELRGGVVTTLQEAFATDWFFATEEEVVAPEYYRASEPGGTHLAQVIAGGPDLPREPIPKSLVALCTTAEKRLWIGTGYFCPDVLLLTALQICAARGVDVRLLVSEKSDHPYLVQIGRSYYEDLLRFGIGVFEYSSGINHAKTVLLDDEWLMVGSANSDNRSMRLNFELNVLVHAPEAARALESMMREDFAASREILLADFAERPFSRRLLEAALRPLAPLL
jgi:cardiolipin synthase